MPNYTPQQLAQQLTPKASIGFQPNGTYSGPQTMQAQAASPGAPQMPMQAPMQDMGGRAGGMARQQAADASRLQQFDTNAAARTASNAARIAENGPNAILSGSTQMQTPEGIAQARAALQADIAAKQAKLQSKMAMKAQDNALADARGVLRGEQRLAIAATGENPGYVGQLSRALRQGRGSGEDMAATYARLYGA